MTRQQLFREYMESFTRAIGDRELKPVVRSGQFEGWHSVSGMTRADRRKEAKAHARGAMRRYLEKQSEAA